jgi:acyl carrier protein
MAEHRGRFALVDPGSGETPWAALAGAIADGESQCQVRDGAVQVPRIVTRTPQPVATDFSDGTVLVTGGTGGLGALVAQRLIEEHGARELVLTSRRGLAATGAPELIERLEGLGASVRIEACDAADRQAVSALLAGLPADRPLVGVVHCAGVLDDGVVGSLTPQRLDKVFRPKVDAAWHLHELTAELPLRAFVLFSSLAGVLGNPGQANYAAANTFLDALAAQRVARGLPAASLAWGPWADVSGMVDGLDVTESSRISRNGIAPLSPEQGLELFDAAISGRDALVVATRWDKAALRTAAQGGGAVPVMLRDLVPVHRDKGGAGGDTVRLAEQLIGVEDKKARPIVLDFVRAQVAGVLAHGSPDDIAVDQPFTELGFDSLAAVELRNRLTDATGLSLPPTLVFDFPTVTSVVDHLYLSLAPSVPSIAESVAQMLDKITVDLVTAEEDERDRVAAALRQALKRLTATEEWESSESSVASATDEEIFAMLDKQL